MILQSLFFYLFAAVLLGSGLMVIGSRNPVHSVLFLILAFFNAAGLFILLGAEFLAMLLVVVYVGAVAVLFLFIVMMLDVDFVELRSGFLQYLPVGMVVGIVLLAELLIALGGWAISPEVAGHLAEPIPAIGGHVEYRGDRVAALYQICFLFPDCGAHPAGGHGWRDRADASSPQGCAAPECGSSGGPYC